MIKSIQLLELEYRLYLTFLPSECQSVGESTYCLRTREEKSSAILVADVNEKGKKLQYREAYVEPFRISFKSGGLYTVRIPSG